MGPLGGAPAVYRPVWLGALGAAGAAVAAVAVAAPRVVSSAADAAPAASLVLSLMVRLSLILVGILTSSMLPVGCLRDPESR